MYMKKTTNQWKQLMNNGPYVCRNELWNNLHSGPLPPSYQPENDGYIPVTITLGTIMNLFYNYNNFQEARKY